MLIKRRNSKLTSIATPTPCWPWSTKIWHAVLKPKNKQEKWLVFGFLCQQRLNFTCVPSYHPNTSSGIPVDAVALIWLYFRLGITCKRLYCFTSDPGLWTTTDKHSWICNKSKHHVLKMYRGRDLFPAKKEPRNALATSQIISRKVKAKREAVATRNGRRRAKRPKQRWNSKKRQLQFRHWHF